MEQGSETRKRAPNFTLKEENFLLSLWVEYADVIELKKTDAATSERKQEAWNNIALQFKMEFGLNRSAKNLKEKYDNMKKIAKKSYTEPDSEVSNGSVITKKSPILEKLASLLGYVGPGGSIDPLDSGNDQDCVYVKTEDVIEDPYHEPTSPAVSNDFIDTESAANQAELYLDEFITNNQLQQENFDLNLNESGDRSPSLNRIGGKRKRYDTAYIETDAIPWGFTEAQRNFFENQEKRAIEKHKWEEENASYELEIKKKQLEKCQLDQEQAYLKLELLKYEVEIKKIELESLTNI